MSLEDMKLLCAGPECGKEIIGTAVIVNDPMNAIDWTGLGIENVLYGNDEDGNEVQSLILHQSCYVELMEAIMKGEHMVVLNVAMGPVGEVKAALAGEE